jgi:hypothetical protein
MVDRGQEIAAVSETETLTLPRVEDNDSDDVRWALETANTLWGQGDQRSALRWLSRAAETAATEENDRRSLLLARAAADLRGRLNLTSSLTPSPQKEPPPPERTLTGLTLDETPAQSQVVAPASVVSQPPTRQAAPAESTKRPSAHPTTNAQTRDDGPPDSERRARQGSSHAAIRVAVGGGLNNEGVLRVRRLGDGEVTREGEHLAMLVSLESDVDLSLL